MQNDRAYEVAAEVIGIGVVGSAEFDVSGYGTLLTFGSAG